MFKKIEKYVREQQMLQKEDCVIAGVSGGADSICLLFVLLELQKNMGFRLAVVHVNHMLRGQSAESDEIFVETLCENLGIDFISYRENVECLSKKWKQSTEEAGRNVRKACFEMAMEKFSGTKIALAHHKNDSAETLLLNLARGTGLKGLCGIAPVQGNVIRPLLCVERWEIEKYLESLKIPYCTDETNAGDDYTRNRIRHHLLSYMEKEVNEKTVSHMSETMGYLRDVQQFLEEQAEIQWENCVLKKGEGFILYKEAFDKVPEALKPVILKKILVSVTGREKDLEAAHIYGLRELLEKQSGRKIDLPYNAEAKRTYEGLFLTVKDEKKQGMKEIVFSPEQENYQIGKYRISCKIIPKDEMENNMENGGVKRFDYDIIQNAVVFRCRQSGDYLTIHKDGRRQKLKSYFINEKIPQEIRDDILLVADGNHILWIYGYRCSSSYLVTEDTKRVLEIRIVEEKQQEGVNH